MRSGSRRELTVNITKPFFEINDYRQVFTAMWDVKRTTQIERKFALLQFAFVFLSLRNQWSPRPV